MLASHWQIVRRSSRVACPAGQSGRTTARPASPMCGRLRHVWAATPHVACAKLLKKLTKIPTDQDYDDGNTPFSCRRNRAGRSPVGRRCAFGR